MHIFHESMGNKATIHPLFGAQEIFIHIINAENSWAA